MALRPRRARKRPGFSPGFLLGATANRSRRTRRRRSVLTGAARSALCGRCEPFRARMRPCRPVAVGPLPSSDPTVRGIKFVEMNPERAGDVCPVQRPAPVRRDRFESADCYGRSLRHIPRPPWKDGEIFGELRLAKEAGLFPRCLLT